MSDELKTGNFVCDYQVSGEAPRGKIDGKTRKKPHWGPGRKFYGRLDFVLFFRLKRWPRSSCEFISKSNFAILTASTNPFATFRRVGVLVCMV